MGWLERFANATFNHAPDVAHDLKTPLNIAVLNLELLRMRIQKLLGHPDEKLNDYSQAIDGELRRVARIFDAYFVFSTPPRDESIERVSISAIVRSARLPDGWRLADVPEAEVFAHRSRLVELVKLTFEGGAKIFGAAPVVVQAHVDSTSCHLQLKAPAPSGESDLGKLFKFYYTDASGNPDLAFATARLIADTYGGSLTIWDENDSRRVLDLQLPRADRANES